MFYLLDFLWICFLILLFRSTDFVLHKWKKKKSADLKIAGEPNSILFSKEEEKILFAKINEIRKYFFNAKKNENYKETLEILSSAKKITDDFFDNVTVNDDNESIKRNRLEL